MEWTVEEVRRSGEKVKGGLWDVYRDRRIVAYDLPIEEAVSRIKGHCQFVRGDTVVKIDQSGFREQMR